MVKKKKISRRKFLALSWMDGSKIYIFPEYRRSTQKWRGFESECNLAVPRTSNLLRFLSFLLGHRTHNAYRYPSSPLSFEAPRQRARWPLPHRLPKSFVLRIFYGTVRQSWLSTSRNIRLVLAGFFIFRAPLPSLCSVIRSIKSFWVSFSSHRGRIF